MTVRIKSPFNMEKIVLSLVAVSPRLYCSKGMPWYWAGNFFSSSRWERTCKLSLYNFFLVRRKHKDTKTLLETQLPGCRFETGNELALELEWLTDPKWLPVAMSVWVWFRCWWRSDRRAAPGLNVRQRPQATHTYPNKSSIKTVR